MCRPWKQGGQKWGSIICHMDLANEANKMFIIWLCWLFWFWNGGPGIDQSQHAKSVNHIIMLNINPYKTLISHFACRQFWPTLELKSMSFFLKLKTVAMAINLTRECYNFNLEFTLCFNYLSDSILGNTPWGICNSFLCFKCLTGTLENTWDRW